MSFESKLSIQNFEIFSRKFSVGEAIFMGSQ